MKLKLRDIAIPLSNGEINEAGLPPGLSPKSIHFNILNPTPKFVFSFHNGVSLDSFLNGDPQAEVMNIKTADWNDYSAASKAFISDFYTNYYSIYKENIPYSWVRGVALDGFSYQHYYPSYGSSLWFGSFLSVNFVKDIINTLTSHPDFLKGKSHITYMSSVIEFCGALSCVVTQERWSEIKNSFTASKDKKSAFAFKSILNSFAHAIINWYFVISNFRIYNKVRNYTVFPNPIYNSTLELLLSTVLYVCLFDELLLDGLDSHAVIISKTQKPQALFRGFVTYIEYINTKFKDQFPKGSLRGLYGEPTSYLSSLEVQTSINRDEIFDSFNRIWNPIRNSLIGTKYCNYAIQDGGNSNINSSLNSSYGACYTARHKEGGYFYKKLKEKTSPQKVPFSPAFSPSLDLPRLRLDVVNSIHAKRPHQLFVIKASNSENKNNTKQLNAIARASADISYVTLTLPMGYYQFNDYYHMFAFVQEAKAVNGLNKPIEDGPAAPLNWTFDFEISVPISNYSIRISETYSHATATENGTFMNNCIDRFTPAIESGHSEVIIFRRESLGPNTLDEVIPSLSSKIILSRNNYDKVFPHITRVAYEGAMCSENETISYRQFNGHGNAGYHLNEYITAGKSTSYSFAVYSLICSIFTSCEDPNYLKANIPLLESLVSLFVAIQINTLTHGPVHDEFLSSDFGQLLCCFATLFEMNSLQSYFNEYVVTTKNSKKGNYSLTDTLLDISLAQSSIYLNPDKAPSLYKVFKFAFTASEKKEPIKIEIPAVAPQPIEVVVQPRPAVIQVIIPPIEIQAAEEENYNDQEDYDDEDDF